MSETKTKRESYNVVFGVEIRPSKIVRQAKEMGLQLKKRDAAYLSGFVSELVSHILQSVKEEKEKENSKSKTFKAQNVNKVLLSSKGMRSINKSLFLMLAESEPVPILKATATDEKRLRKARKRRTQKTDLEKQRTQEEWPPRPKRKRIQEKDGAKKKSKQQQEAT